MFTVCPKCTLTLALTTADLRMGQGYVRCGRCANVFNALLTLSEEPSDENSAASAHEQADPASASQIQAVQFEELGESDASAAAHGADESAQSADEVTQITESSEISAVPSASTATDTSDEGAIENESNYAEGTGTLETIVLEGDAITQTEEYVPEESVDSEIAALTERLGRTAHEPPSSAQALAAQFAPPPEPDSPPQSQSSWLVLSALMLLLLTAQAVHHWRERLAMSPLWSAPLTSTYAALGMPLDPHWSLAAYDVRQQGATSDPTDSQVIRVRMSLANHATRAQPLPLVRVTLLDRYGKRLAMRDLTPSEYWPAGAPARTFLYRDERIESEVTVRDPNAASASFELDVCLRDSNGAVRCAADIRPVTARAPMLPP
jgi:predicted Zn finger-like uncharacterized protein